MATPGQDEMEISLAGLLSERSQILLPSHWPVVDLTDDAAAANLPGDIVVIDLSRATAVSLVEAYAFRRQDVAMIVIGDDLPAGVVRALLRFQASDVLADSATSEDVVASIRDITLRIASRAAPAETGNSATCWAFLGAVGGAGATTLALESAFHVMAETPHKSVCLIDLNLANGMATSLLDGQAKLDLRTLCSAPERLDATLLRVYAWTHEKGVQLIAAPTNRLAESIANEQAVLGLLDVACSVYDHVILDMPRHRTEWTDPILGAVNEAVVVSELTVPSLHAGADLCRAIDGLREANSPAHLVLNRMFSKKSHRHSFPIDKAEHAVQRKIDHIVRSDWETARMAVNVGMPMSLVKPRSPAVKDMNQFAHLLLQDSRGALLAEERKIGTRL